MNNVQVKYSPPRLIALALGIVVFAVYQGWWREELLRTPRFGDPVPLPFAIWFSAIIGYGLAMLGWLVWTTRRQVWATVRPTRGRILGALALGAVAPLVIFSWIPWIAGGLALAALFGGNPLAGVAVWLAASLAAYPLAAMILRHTYQRHWLRFWLFCLCFWTAYAVHMLLFGVRVFTL